MLCSTLAATSAPPAPAPLNGVRVLDLTRYLPGPYATLVLAQLGAEVLKVEDPRGGDPARYGPPLKDGVSVAFQALNRGKAPIALDLKSAGGREALGALVGDADVLVESFRPGVLDRLGCGYAALGASRPSLVWCAITGYGQQGARAHKAGHDLNYVALSGLLSLNGASVGAAGGSGPAVPGFQIADIAGGALWAALRITAALLAARQTGRGAYLDVSMTAGVTALAALSVSEALANHPPAPGSGVLSGEYACYSVYATSCGGHMALAALEPKFWAVFCGAAGRPDWIPKQFAAGASQRALRDEVQALFATRSRSEWEAIFEPLDACCEPVLSVAEALDRSAKAGEPWAQHAINAATHSPTLPSLATSPEAGPALAPMDPRLPRASSGPMCWPARDQGAQ